LGSNGIQVLAAIELNTQLAYNWHLVQLCRLNRDAELQGAHRNARQKTRIVMSQR
jgi:hypothetical protein